VSSLGLVLNISGSLSERNLSCAAEQKPKKSRDDEDKTEEASKTFFFVISLKRPIHQGQQRYSHLVLQTTDANGDITSPIAEVRGHL
jgi:hypothetical protein